LFALTFTFAQTLNLAFALKFDPMFGLVRQIFRPPGLPASGNPVSSAAKRLSGPKIIRMRTI